jgi:putative Mg2+ transporter-C (MgtC) family protein
LQHGGGDAELAAVVRGIAPGIGFIGAGAILKLAAEREIKGLTTAASIWLTAAVGMATGAGMMWPALISVLLSLFVLAVLGQWENRFQHVLKKRDRAEALDDTRTFN